MAHFYQDCHFDFVVFNNKMKASLYNTKRNVAKRVERVRVRQVAAVPKPATQATAPPTTDNGIPPRREATDAEIASMICTEAGFEPPLTLHEAVRKVRFIVFGKDPLDDNQEIQDHLEELRQNAAYGLLTAAEKNVKAIIAAEPGYYGKN